MPDFYFQQYASRGREGYSWLQERLQPPAMWLQEFEGTLSRVFPGDNQVQETKRMGGVYISPTGDFAALFAFRPAEPDHFGRQGGIVTNVLFFKSTLLPTQSLKRAWEHPCLAAKAQENIPAIVFISLDQNFGTTPEQQDFFGCLQNWQPGKTLLIKFTAEATTTDFTAQTIPLPKPTPPAVPRKQQQDPQSPISKSSIPTKDTPMQENHVPVTPQRKSHHTLCFILGILLGSVLAIAGTLFFLHHTEPNDAKGVSNENALFQCEVPVGLNLSHGRFTLEMDCEVEYFNVNKPSILKVHNFEIRKPETTDVQQQ